MKTKICNTCNKELPLTLDYFFRRIIKQKLASGKVAKYETFRSKCKKCHMKESEERRIKKRCEEMGCEVDDYRKFWKKQYSETRTLYPEIAHLTKKQQQTVRNKIKNGYVFTTYEQYKLDCRSNVSKVRRKYNYGNKKLVTVKERNQARTKAISDAYIANSLGLSVNEIPKEIIETKRLIIKLKRELKLTNYGT